MLVVVANDDVPDEMKLENFSTLTISTAAKEKDQKAILHFNQY